jgi:hypothetical protein
METTSVMIAATPLSGENLKSLAAICTVSLVASALVGCVSNPANYRPSVQAISEPPLNVERAVSLGEDLVRQGRFTEHAAIVVSRPFKAGLYGVNPGTYLKTGEDEHNEYFFPGGERAGSIYRPALVDDWSSVIVRKGGESTVCVMTSYGTAITTCAAGYLFERRNVALMSENSFQQTLIYNGRVGNKINIGYREFSSSMARPAFNNSVEYDLGESRSIAYRGAQIDVVEATNQKIRYIVRKNFNEAVK